MFQVENNNSCNIDEEHSRLCNGALLVDIPDAFHPMNMHPSKRLNSQTHMLHVGSGAET